MKIKIPADRRTRVAYLRAHLVPVIKIEENGEIKLIYGEEIDQSNCCEISTYYYVTQEERQFRKKLYDFGRTHNEVQYKNMILGKEYLALVLTVEESGTLYDPPTEDYLASFYFEYNHLETYKLFA